MTLTVESALSKLSPLMPDRVTRWRRTLALSSASTKSLIERQILATYFRLLNGSSMTLLLPPPPQDLLSGTFSLGTVSYHNDQGNFALREEDLLQHLAIFGRSGAGKTNIAYLLMTHLIERRIPFVFFDWKRTARDLLKIHPRQMAVFTPGRSLRPLPFDLFMVPPGMETTTFIHMAVDVIGDAYTLGDGAKNLLTKAVAIALTTSSNPSSQTVLDHLMKLDTAGRSAGWKTSAVRALESIVFTQGKSNLSGETSGNTLLQMQTILELDAVSANYKQCLIPLLCLYLFHAHLTGGREKLRFVIFVEEAHHLLHQQRGSRETVMEMLLRQCRELGIAIIILDQHPHLISPAVLGNTASTILLNLKDPKDIATAGKLALLPESDRQHLSQLPLGSGIIKLQSRYRKPFMVKFAKFDVEKGSVLDEDLERLAAPTTPLSGRIEPRKAKNVTLAVSRSPDNQVTEEEFRLLSDVQAHPYDGVDARYRRLAWSAERGNRAKTHMLALRLLEEESISTSRSRKTLLRISQEARRRLGLDAQGQRRESLLHEYWKHIYAEYYQSQGYEVMIEAPRHSGRMDILARKSGESVAIEIETGKSDVVENVREDLRFGCAYVVVVAAARHVQGHLEAVLGKAGLLLPERVRLIVAGETVG